MSESYVYLQHTGAEIDANIDEVVNARGGQTTLAGAMALKATKSEIAGFIEIGDVFGKGEEISANADLDDIDTIGIYYEAGTSWSHDNCPVEDVPFSLEVRELTADVIMQTLYVADDAYSGDYYARMRYTGVPWGEWAHWSNSGSGTSNYNDLTNKPQINGYTLSGNKSAANLGLQETISDIAAIRSGASAGATALQQTDVSSTYSPSGTAPVNGTAVKAAMTGTLSTSDEDHAATSKAVFDGLAGKTDISQVWGRGVALKSTDDCNDLKDAGMYYAASSSDVPASNSPFTSAGFMLRVEKFYQALGADAGIVQTAESYISNTFYQKKRIYFYTSGGVGWRWTEWATTLNVSMQPVAADRSAYETMTNGDEPEQEEEKANETEANER